MDGDALRGTAATVWCDLSYRRSWLDWGDCGSGRSHHGARYAVLCLSSGANVSLRFG